MEIILTGKTVFILRRPLVSLGNKPLQEIMLTENTDSSFRH